METVWADEDEDDDEVGGGREGGGAGVCDVILPGGLTQSHRGHPVT